MTSPVGQVQVADPRPRVVAVGGVGYLVTIDGTETETSPSVMYDPERRMIGHVAMVGSHLKMLNGYSAPFEGDDDERKRIETDVLRLLAETPR